MPATTALWIIRGLALAYSIWRAHSDRPEAPKGPSYARDPIRNPRRNDLPVPLVYGENLVIGNIIQQNLHLEDEGTEDERVTGVDYILGLAEGKVKSVQNVMAGEAPVTYLPGTTYKAQASGFGYQFGGSDDRVNFRVREEDVGGWIEIEIDETGGAWPELRDGKTKIDFWGHAVYVNGEMRNTPGLVSENIPITEHDVGWWSIVSFLRTFGKAHTIRATIYRPVEELDEGQVRFGKREQLPYDIPWDTQNYPFTASILLELGPGELTVFQNPLITAIVEGRFVKVWDGSEWVEEYTKNPAWIVLDLLTDKRAGAGKDLGSIDVDSFVDAANYCDELIDAGGSNLPGEQEKRFEFDGILDTQMNARDSIKSVLSTFRANIIQRKGKIALHINKVENETIQTFDTNNIIEGTLKRSKLGYRQKPNKITIEYLDPQNNYEPTQVSAENHFDVLNSGQIREEVISLYGIKRRSQAKRTAYYFLYEIWLTDTFCEWEAGIDSVHCEVGDVIEITHPEPGWVEKKIRILDIKELPNDNIKLVGQEYSPNVYTDEDVEFEYPRGSTLPNPNELPSSVEGLALEEVFKYLRDGTVIPLIRATWTNPTDNPYWSEARVFLSKDNGENWEFIRAISSEIIDIEVGEIGDYLVRVVSETTMGKREDFETAPTESITITGDPGPPPDPSFTFAGFDRLIYWQLALITHPHFQFFEVRTDTNFGVESSHLIYQGPHSSHTERPPLGDYPSDTRQYTLYAKSCNKSGVYSEGTAQITVSNLVPSPIPPPTVFVGFNSIRLDFEPIHETEGHEDVDNYNLYVTPVNELNEPTGDTETISLGRTSGYTILSEPGERYSLQVAAEDVAGEGEKSPIAYGETQPLKAIDIPEGIIDGDHLSEALSGEIDSIYEQAFTTLPGEIEELSGQIGEAGIKTFQQDTEPTEAEEGDLWIDTSLDIEGNPRNALHRYDGTEWVVVRDTGIAIAFGMISELEGETEDSVSYVASLTTLEVTPEGIDATVSEVYPQGTGQASSISVLSGQITLESGRIDEVEGDLGTLEGEVEDSVSYVQSLAVLQITPEDISSTVGVVYPDGTGQISRVEQNAQSITSIVESIGEDEADFISKVQQLANNFTVKIQTYQEGVIKAATGFQLSIDEEDVSAFTIHADHFKVFLPAIGIEKAAFGVGYVDGVATVGVAGDMILDGTITAKAIEANFFQAYYAEIGAAFIQSAHIVELSADKISAGEISASLTSTQTFSLKDSGGLTRAGLTAVTAGDGGVRIWSGSTYSNRNTAPFRVTQGGALYAEDVFVKGAIEAEEFILPIRSPL